MKNKLHVYFIAFVLLAVFTLLAVSSIWPDRKSPTADELAHHIPVGYVLLSKGDFKMDPSQPPLPRYIAALPLKLFMDLNMPDDRNEWRREDRSEFGKDFFYKYNSQPHRMIFYSRCAFIGIGIICGIILFMMARAFYGDRAALFSLFLYSLSPNILAHTRLSTVDMTATCFMLLAVYTFWRFTQNTSIVNIIISGISLGVAQLSKYTAVLLYPMFLFLILFELPRLKRGEKAGVVFKLFMMFAISVVVLWAGYGFNTDPILYDAMRVGEKLSIAHSITGKVLPFWNDAWNVRLDNFLLESPFPLGTHVLGVLGVLRHGYEGHGSFFLGELISHGHPLYFVVAFLIKTPIPMMIFLVTGTIITLRRGVGKEERFLFLPIAAFFLIATFSSLQLGLRYILPVYPFCFILAGRSVELFSKKRAYSVIGGLLMLWYFLSALVTWPDYLSYFNETIGGPANGYKYLRDSNIDWGQDLPALKDYMDKNNIKKVKLFYVWTASPESYAIEYEELDQGEFKMPASYVYAISVDSLSSVKWTECHEPVYKAGNSIFIYDLRFEEK